MSSSASISDELSRSKGNIWISLIRLVTGPVLHATPKAELDALLQAMPDKMVGLGTAFAEKNER